MNDRCSSLYEDAARRSEKLKARETYRDNQWQAARESSHRTNRKAKVYVARAVCTTPGFVGSYHRFWKERVDLEARNEVLDDVPLEKTIKMRSRKAKMTGTDKYFPRGYANSLNNSSRGMSSVLEDEMQSDNQVAIVASTLSPNAPQAYMVPNSPRAGRCEHLCRGLEDAEDGQTHDLFSPHFSHLKDLKLVPKVRRTRPVPWEHPPQSQRRYRLGRKQPVVPQDCTATPALALPAADVELPKSAGTQPNPDSSTLMVPSLVSKIETPLPPGMQRGSPCPSGFGLRSDSLQTPLPLSLSGKPGEGRSATEAQTQKLGLSPHRESTPLMDKSRRVAWGHDDASQL